MTTPVQHRSSISQMRMRAATTTLGLAIMCTLLSLTILTQPAQTQTLTVLYTFTGGTDGGGPEAGLIRDASGNLYGTTSFGGDPNADVGVAYEVDPTGKETVLHTFTGGSDGATPFAKLIRGQYGRLYGTTAYGGTAGAGTAFKLGPRGKYTVLHNFTGKRGDGSLPPAGLVRDRDGHLYGTTMFGGTVYNGHQYGTVFKLSKTGKETVLYSFKGAADGAYPTADLVARSSRQLVRHHLRRLQHQQRNRVQGRRQGPRDRSVQFHRRNRRRISLGRLGSRRAGEPLWHHSVWRQSSLLRALRLRNRFQSRPPGVTSPCSTVSPEVQPMASFPSED